MAKYTKFTLTPYGELVYKKTGQFVTKDYEIRGNRVYSKGRLKGYISKATKKDIEKQIKAEKGREKWRSKIRKQLPAQATQGLDLGDFTAIKSSLGAIDTPISKSQRSYINYASQLADMVDSGYISEKTAKAYLMQYENAKTDVERTKLWNKLKALEKDVGYIPSD